MKKFFLIGIAVMASLISIQAQQFYTTNNLPATNNTLLSQGAVLQVLTLWSTNTTPTIVQLRDGDLTAVTAAYTNYLTYTTNVISTYINFGVGTTNTQTNTMVTYVANPHAAATNNVNPIVQLVVPASPSILTYTFRPQIQFVNKVTLSNNVAGVNAILQYRSP